MLSISNKLIRVLLVVFHLPLFVLPFTIATSIPVTLGAMHVYSHISRPAPVIAKIEPHYLGEVLAENTAVLTGNIDFNIPAAFNANVSLKRNLEVAGESTFSGNIRVLDKNIDAGQGKITASNLLYGVLPGNGIAISTGQTPTITNTGVISFGGKTGALKLEGGSGISIDGTKITNTGITSLTAGDGIEVSGSAITNSDKGSDQEIFKTIAVDGQDSVTAGTNTDTLTLIAGAGISLTTSAGSKSLTIGNVLDASATTGWVDGGSSVYLQNASDLVGIGTSSPLATLHIVATDGIIIPIGTTAQRPGSPQTGTIRYNSSTNQFEGYAASNWGSLGGVSDVDQNTYISAETIAGANNDDLAFYTAGTLRMFINESGNVGIGTSNPLGKLDVNGQVRLSGNTTSTVLSNALIYYDASAQSQNNLVYAINTNKNSPGDNDFTVDAQGNITAHSITLSGGASINQESLTVSDSTTLGTSAGTQGWDNDVTVQLGTGTLSMTYNNDTVARSLMNFNNTTDTLAIGNANMVGSFTTSDWAISAIGNLTGIGSISADGAVTLSGLSGGSGSAICLDGSNNLVTCVTGTGGIAGSGTAGYVPYFNTSTSIANSGIFYSGGNVGIGTTAPTTKLHVAGDARITGALYDSSNSAGSSGMILSSIGTGTSWSSLATLGIVSGTGTDNYLARWNSAGTGVENGTLVDNATSGISLNIDSSNNVGIGGTAASTNPRLYVGASGNVGVGTTNPAVKFQVGDGSASVFSRVQGTNSTISIGESGSTRFGYAAGQIGLVMEASGTVPLAIGQFSSQPLIFGTNNTEWMRITSGGNVGIGTTAPTTKLHVAGDARITGALYDSSNSAGTSGYVLTTTGTGTSWTSISSAVGSSAFLQGGNTFGALAQIGTNDNYGLGIRTSGVERVRVNTNGNVGIGTTSPSQLVDINGGSVLINNSGTGLLYLADTTGFVQAGSGYMQMRATGDSKTAYITSDAEVIFRMDYNNNGSANYFDFETNNGTSLMRLNESGNLGIGTVSPAIKLHVVGNGTNAAAFMSGNVGIGTTSPGAALEIWGSGGEKLRLRNDSSNNNYLSFYNSGTSKGYLQYANNETYLVNSAAGGMHFFTNDTEKLTILSGGNVGIGTAAPSSLFAVGSSSQFQINSSGAIAAATGVTSSGTIAFTGLTTGSGSAICIDGSNNLVTCTTGAGGIAGSGTSGYISYFNTSSSIANSNLYYTSGNIGIGTTAPGQLLSVAGTLGILEGGSSPQYYTTFQGGDQSGAITYTLPVNDGGSNQILATDGNGVLSWIDVSGGAGGISGSGITNYVTRWTGTSSLGTGVLYDNGTNVGIGTTSPTAKLHVVGIDGLDSTSPLLFIQNNDQSTNQGHGLQITAGNANTSDRPILVENRLGQDFFSINGLGMTTFSSYDSHDQTSHLVTIYNAEQSNGQSNGLKIQAGNGSSDQALLVESRTGTDFFTIDGVGLTSFSANVGVGTTLPLTKLHVVGNGTYAATFMSGNVGIGTTAPSEKIEINSGNLKVISGSDYIILNPSSGGNPLLQFFNAGVADAQLTATANGFEFNTNGRFNGDLRSTGSITSSPSGGNTNGYTSAGLLDLWSPSGNATYISFNENNIANRGILGFAAGNADLVYRTGATTMTNGTELFRITSGGNVGIGTTSPSEKLEVTGNIKNSGYIAVNSLGTYLSAGDIGLSDSGKFTSSNLTQAYWMPSSGTLQAQGDLTLSIYGFGTVMKFLSSNGNVGIGTVTPAGLLDVNGKLTVLSGGNVGIGTTSPETKVNIAGGSALRLGESAGGNTYADYTRSGITYTGNYTIGNTSGSLTGTINTDRQLFLNSNGGHGIFLQTSGTSRLGVTQATTYLTSTNVGIGTTGPAVQLHVVGNNTNAAVFMSGNVGIGTTLPSSLFAVGSSSQFQVDSSGRVGLGANPSTNYKLYVNGNILMGNTYKITSDAATQSWLQFNGSDTTLNTQNDLFLGTYNGVDQGTNTRLTIKQGGNIGVGTTSPSSLFAVGSSSQFQINSSGAIAAATGVTSSGTISFTGLASGTGNAICLDGSNNLVTCTVGSGGVSGSGTAGQLAFFTTGSNISSDSNIYFNNTSKMLGVGTTSPLAKLHVVGNGTYAAAFMSGNVGIGTTSPTTVLDVRNNSIDSIGWGGTASQRGILSWGSSDARLYATSGNKLQLGANGGTAHMVIDTSGNVGIGTTAPGQKLEVAGNALISGSGTLTVGSTSNSHTIVGEGNLNIKYTTESRLMLSSNANSEFGVTAGASGDGGIRLGQAGSYSYLSSSGGNLILQNPAGNVGIGTTSPGSLLAIGDGGAAVTSTIDLNGGTNSGAGAMVKFRRGGGAAQGWIGTDSLVQGGTSNDLTIAGNNTNIRFYTGANGTTEYMRLNNSGNLGIGTTDPANLLHLVKSSSGAETIPLLLNNRFDVVGTATALGFASYNGNTVTGKVSNIQHASGYDLALSTYNQSGGLSEKIRIKHDGNVGIGTTAPSTKLHVVGDARITGALYDSSNSAGSSGMLLTSTGTGTTWATVASTLDSSYFKQNGNSFGGLATLGTNDSYGLALETGGSERLRIDTSGNVGIGTTNPTSALEARAGTGYSIFKAGGTAAGSGYLELVTSGESNAFLNLYGSSATDRGYIYFNNNAGTVRKLQIGNNFSGTAGTLADISAFGSVQIGIDATNTGTGVFEVAKANSYNGRAGTDGTSLLYINNAGNVGLGTISPSEKLDIAGASSNITFSNATGPHQIKTGGSTHLALMPGGNVGIGTTSPGQKLDVSGNIAGVDGLFSGQVRTGGATSSNVSTNGIIVPNNNYINGAVAANNDSHKLLGLDASNKVQIDLSGLGVIFGGNVTANKLIGGASANSSLSLQSTSGSGTSDFINFTVGVNGGTEAMRVTSSGNVGIGTTAPSTKLHVVGDARITGALYDSSNSAGSSGMILTSTGTGTTWATVATTLDSSYFKQNGNSFGGLATLGTNDSNALAFETAGSERLRIDTSGNVGIGTVSPGYGLEVTGTGSINGIAFDSTRRIFGGGVITYQTNDTSNQHLFTNAIGTSFGGANADLVKFQAATSGQTLNSGSAIAHFVGDGGNTVMRVLSSGNVGIGTTAPGVALDVVGGIRTQTNGFAISNSPLPMATAVFRTQNDYRLVDDGDFGINNATTRYVTVKSDGNVGIGTASPISKLHVNGDIRVATGSKVILYGSAGSDDNSIFRDTGTGDMVVSSPTDIQLNTGLTSRLVTIKQSGNVGIGTTAPAQKLDVSGRINSTLGYGVGSPATGVGYYISGTPLTSTNIYGFWDFATHTLSGNGTEVMSFRALHTVDTTASNFSLTNDYGLRIGASSKLGSGTITNAYGAYIDTPTIGTNNYGLYVNGGTTVLNASAGNVGIGTTAPTAQLEIGTPSNGHYIQINPSGGAYGIRSVYSSESNPRWQIGTDQIGSGLSALTFNNNGAATTAANGVGIGIAGTRELGFYTSNATALTERMRINASGNVGIGTTAPSTKLHVVGDARITGALYDSSNSAGSSGMLLTSTGTGTTWATVATTLDSSYFKQNGNSFGGLATLGTNDSYGLALETGGSERLRIDTSGNVSIGTSQTLGDALTIEGSSSTAAYMNIFTTGGGSAASPALAGIKFGSSDSSYFVSSIESMSQSANYVHGVMKFNVAGNITTGTIEERMRIDGVSGNVGIGTTSPLAKLHVAGSVFLNGGNQIQITNSNGSTGFQIVGGDGSTNIIGTMGSNEPLAIRTGATERMRIDSSGNVGIGTTSPGAVLDLQGSVSQIANFKSSYAGGVALTIEGTHDLAIPVLQLKDSGTSGKTWNLESGRQAGSFSIYGGDAGQALTILTGGNMGIGTTSPTAKLDVLGTTRHTLIGDWTDNTGYAAISLGGSLGSGANFISAGSQLIINRPTGSDISFRENNGADQLTILNTSGNVGIGTTNPQDKLEIAGNLRLSNNGSNIYFTGGEGQLISTSNIVMDLDFDNNETDRVFKIRTNAGGSELFRVQENGNVGIGTTSPGAKLEVSNAGSVIARYSGTSATDYRNEFYRAGSRIGLVSWDTGLFGLEGDSSNSVALNFRTGGVDRLRILTGGNVGIGTTAPIAKLHVNGVIYSPFSGGLYLSDSNLPQCNGGPCYGIGGSNLDFGGGASSVIQVAGYYGLNFSTNNTSRIAIINGGNVGIGTTAPSQELHLNGEQIISSSNFNAVSGTPALDINGAWMRIGDGVSGQTFPNGIGIKFHDGEVAHGTLKYLPSVNRFDFCESSSDSTALCDSGEERLSIGLSTGNIGIGTTSPSQKLQIGDASNDGTVYIAGKLSGGVTSTQDSLMVMSYGSAAGTQGGIVWGGAVNQTMANISYGGRLSANNSNNVFIDSISDTSASSMNFRMRTYGTDVNAMTILGDGNVGIGTTAPTEALNVVGSIKQNYTGHYAGLLWNNTDTGAGGILAHHYLDAATAFGQSILFNAYQTGNGATQNLKRLRASYNPVRITTDVHRSSMFEVLYGSTGSADSDISSWVSALKIDFSGNIGIGTTAPSAKLEVLGEAIFGTNATKLKTYSDSTYSGIYNGSSLTSDEAIYMGGGGLYVYADGSERVRIDSSGNVGIGTTNPAHKLDVNGDIRALGGDIYSSVSRLTDSASSSYLRIDPQNNWVIQYDGTSDQTFSVFDNAGAHYISLFGDAATSTLTTSGAGNDLSIDAAGGDIAIGSSDNININGNLYVANSTGNIGIGTTAPGYKLDVNGTSVFRDDLLIYNQEPISFVNGQFIKDNSGGGLVLNSNIYKLQLQGGTDSTNGIVELSTNNAVRMVINNGGNVGIGTTAPGAKLDIAGGDIQVDSTKKLYLDDGGDTYVYESSANVLDLIAGGVSSLKIRSSDIIIPATNKLYLDGGSNTYLSEVAGDQINFVTGGTERVRFDSSGNVGIGTTAPIAKLHVNGGNIYSTGGDIVFTEDATARYLRLANNGGAIRFRSNSAAATDRGLQFGNMDNSQIWTSYMTLDAGNVGIGTTAPSAKLEVAGSLNSSNSSIRITNTDTNSYVTLGSGIPAISNSGFNLSLDGSSRLVVSSSGNVGIGTTSPNEKLHIEGTGGGFVNIQRSDSVSANGGLRFKGSDGVVDAEIAYNNAVGSAMTFYSNSATRMIIDSSGNVGIGTTSPGYKLEVNGTLFTTGTAQFSNGSVVTGTGKLYTNSDDFYLSADDNANGTGKIHLSNSGTEVMTLNSGNVGIGTTAPASNLHIGTAGSSILTLERIDTSVSANDPVGKIQFYAKDTSTTTNSIIADIEAQATNTVGTDINPGRLIFRTTSTSVAATPTERMRIDEAGNVGIGTTAPLAKLNTTTGFNNTVSLYALGSPTNGTFTDELGLVRSKAATVLGSGIGDTTGLALNVYTYTKDGALTVLGNGNVGIGTTSPARELQVAGNVRIGTGTTGCLEDADGTLLAGTCSSDVNLKKNITGVSNILEKLTQLNVSTYQWNDLAAQTYKYGTEATQIGLIAQNVESVFPELININQEGYKQVNFNAFPFYTIQALKELKLNTEGQIANLASASGNSTVMQADLNLLKETSASMSAKLDEVINSTSVESIASLSARLDTLESRANHADEQIASVSGRLAYLEEQMLGTGAGVLGVETGLLDSETATISALTVSGNTNLYNLGVTGTINNGLLNINGFDDSLGTPAATINTLGGALKLQSNALANLDIMDGRVIIDTDGNIETTGEITTKKIKTEKLEIIDPDPAVETHGNASLQTKSIGEGILEAGTTEIVIETTAVTENSVVFVTSKTKTTATLAVTDQIEGESFTVEIPTAALADIKFNWWVVN